MPGGRIGTTDKNDEVCAVTHDDALICEIQRPRYPDHQTHGFRLSPHGSSIH